MDLKRNRDLLKEIRRLFTVHVHAQQRVDMHSNLSRDSDDVKKEIQEELMYDLAQEIDKFSRKTVSDDPRYSFSVFENDVLIIVDPSGLFTRLEQELDAAYERGYKQGISVANAKD